VPRLSDMCYSGGCLFAYPRLHRALWLLTLVDAAVLRGMDINVGIARHWHVWLMSSVR
jgi:hypothetical protein